MNNIWYEQDNDVNINKNIQFQIEKWLTNYPKDNSGIMIEGTKEQRRNLTSNISEWFKPVIKDIINNLRDYNSEVYIKFQL